jgi:hypothetical protein
MKNKKEIKPCELKEAKDFIQKYHRHHKPPQGHRFSLKLVEENKIRGVIVVGRPIGRFQDDGETIEITRVCTDGMPNACSMLIGAVRRVGKAMGWKRIISYILETENGASYKASNFQLMGITKGDTWNRKKRSRKDEQPTCIKKRWEIKL